MFKQKRSIHRFLIEFLFVRPKLRDKLFCLNLSVNSHHTKVRDTSQAWFFNVQSNNLVTYITINLTCSNMLILYLINFFSPCSAYFILLNFMAPDTT